MEGKGIDHLVGVRLRYNNNYNNNGIRVWRCDNGSGIVQWRAFVNTEMKMSIPKLPRDLQIG
jgi:hypothetical protein